MCPGRSRSAAAARALATTNSGRPSRSASARSMNQARSSASRFCVNSVPRTASRDLTVVIRSARSPSSSAPARTNMRRYSISTRCCSSVRDSASRACHNASIRPNRARLLVISDEKADSLGARSRCRASRAGVLSDPAMLKKTPATRSSVASASSSASMVLAKVAGAGLSAIAAMAARASASPASNAGAKSSSRIRSKGGKAKAVVHGASSALVMAGLLCGQTMDCAAQGPPACASSWHKYPSDRSAGTAAQRCSGPRIRRSSRRRASDRVIVIVR